MNKTAIVIELDRVYESEELYDIINTLKKWVRGVENVRIEELEFEAFDYNTAVFDWLFEVE